MYQETPMRWFLAFTFGLLGAGAGFLIIVADERAPGRWALPLLAGGIFATLGAVIGGTGDIVRALRRGRHHRDESGHRHGDPAHHGAD
jgi:hypothetical protein